MIVLTEHLIKALEKTKEKNVYLMGLRFDKRRVLDLLKANDNHETVELTTGKLSWHDVSYHIETERSHDTSTGLVGNKVKSSRAIVSDVKDKPCVQFYFNHKKPIITARMFELWQADKPFATIKINTGGMANPALTGIAINPELLLSAINVVSPAMATEYSREVLAAMYFELTPDKITLTSADGFRLVTTSFLCETGMTANFLIDQADIPKLVSMINAIGKKRYHGNTAYDSEVYLNTAISLTTHKAKDNYNKGTVTFSIPNKTVTFNTVQGNFPQYSKLIPDDNGTSFDFPSFTLLKTIMPLKRICKESSGIVRLQIADGDTGLQGVLTVSAHAEEVGDTVVKCNIIKPNVRYSGSDKPIAYNKIAMNYFYLVDALRSLGDKTVTAYLTTPSSPFKFVSGNVTMVLMPMFVQWETAKPEPIPEPTTITNETEDEDIDTSEMDAVNNDNGLDNNELARETATV